MPGPLKNARHERFAQELAKGKSVDDAYAAVGYTPNRGNAARLKAKEGILSRLTELQVRTAEKATTTAADIAAQLDEDRSFARNLKQAAAAVSASLGKAKVLGLIIDRAKVEHEGNIILTITSEDASL